MAKIPSYHSILCTMVLVHRVRVVKFIRMIVMKFSAGDGETFVCTFCQSQGILLLPWPMYLINTIDYLLNIMTIFYDYPCYFHDRPIIQSGSGGRRPFSSSPSGQLLFASRPAGGDNNHYQNNNHNHSYDKNHNSNQNHPKHNHHQHIWTISLCFSTSLMWKLQ